MNAAILWPRRGFSIMACRNLVFKKLADDFHFCRRRAPMVNGNVLQNCVECSCPGRMQHFADGRRMDLGSDGLGVDAIFPVAPDKPNDPREQSELYREVEAVEDGFETGIGVPACAEPHADVGEDVAPWPGADEGVEVEADLVHPGDASG